MSFPCRDEMRIAHMIEACREIIEIADVDKSAFDVSKEKKYSLIHLFTILGEAASRVSDEFKSAHEDVEWFKASGMRNRLVHDYMATDVEIVWAAAKHDIPILLEHLEAIGVCG